MRKRLALNWLRLFVEPRHVLALPGLWRYLSNWRQYRRLVGHAGLRWRDSFPRLDDWTEHTPFDAHYFYQACWAARVLADRAPSRHVDVGSSVAMVGIISAFVPTVFVDVRPLLAAMDGLTCVAGNLVGLPFRDASIASLSSLHVIEHVGLGRYGDQLDPEGSRRAAAELVRVLAPGGRLLVSTPVGRSRTEFNAHRVFRPEMVEEMFAGVSMRRFAMVDDDGRFRRDAVPSDARDAEYACGMFEFERPAH